MVLRNPFSKNKVWNVYKKNQILGGYMYIQKDRNILYLGSTCLDTILAGMKDLYSNSIHHLWLPSPEIKILR